MKKGYMKPIMQVEYCETAVLICTSVINPGKPNTPAGVKSFADFDGWDDTDYDVEAGDQGYGW